MNRGEAICCTWPLSVALLLGPILLSCLVPSVSDAQGSGFDQGEKDRTPWWDGERQYRMFYEVTAPTWWEQAPAADRLNGLPIRAEVAPWAAMTSPYNRSSLVLVQYDKMGRDGKVLLHRPDRTHPNDAALPFRASWKAEGTSERLFLEWLLFDDDPATSSFCLYFNVRDGPSAETVDVSEMMGPLEALDWIAPGTVFYGFDPGVEGFYPQDHNITVIGLYDGTGVTIEDITRSPSAPEKAGFRFDASVERMGKVTFQPPTGSYFRVTADRPVVAHISAGMERGGGKTFYPSLDGGTVGRRFIIDAFPDVSWSDMAMVTHVYGIENASFKFYDANGSLFASGNVKAGGLATVPLAMGSVVDVRSTGDIIIESAAINSIGAMPSVNGAPVGRTFFGSTQNFTGEALHVQPHADDVSITVTDLSTGQVIIDGKRVTGYETFFDSRIGNRAIRLDATADVSAAIGSTEFGAGIEAFGDDVTFVGGKGARDFRAYAYRNPPPAAGDEPYLGEPAPGIVFAFEDGTNVDIDGQARELDAGGYATLGQGYHHITSDRPVSVMALGRDADDGDRHRWNDWGSYLAGHITPLTPQFYGFQKGKVSFELRPGAGETAVDDVIIHAVEPGDTTMFRIELANTGDLPDTYTLGTMNITPGGNFTGLPGPDEALAAGEVRRYEIGLSVPGGTPAGTRYAINITALSMSLSGGGEDHVVLEAVVDPERFVDMDPIDIRYVDPGGTAGFVINVTNKGNADDVMLLSAAEASQGACDGWTWAFGTDALSLGMGGRGSAMLDVTAPEDALAGATCGLWVAATSANDTGARDGALAITIVNQIFGIGAAFENESARAAPGSAARFVLRITNLGNGADPCTISLVDGGSGQVSFSFANTASPPVRGTVAIDVSALVASDALVGDVPFKIRVMDSKGLEVLVNGTVGVSQVFSISLTVDRDEVWLEPKEGHDFAITLANTGNGPDHVSLTLDPSDGGELSQPGPHPLGPGESARLTLHVDAGKGDVSVRWIKVHASSEGDATSDLLLTVYVDKEGMDTTIIPEPPCMLLVAMLMAGLVTTFYTRMRMEKRHG